MLLLVHGSSPSKNNPHVCSSEWIHIKWQCLRAGGDWDQSSTYMHSQGSMCLFTRIYEHTCMNLCTHTHAYICVCAWYRGTCMCTCVQTPLTETKDCMWSHSYSCVQSHMTGKAMQGLYPDLSLGRRHPPCNGVHTSLSHQVHGSLSTSASFCH